MGRLAALIDQPRILADIVAGVMLGWFLFLLPQGVVHGTCVGPTIMGPFVNRKLIPVEIRPLIKTMGLFANTPHWCHIKTFQLRRPGNGFDMPVSWC